MSGLHSENPGKDITIHHIPIKPLQRYSKSNRPLFTIYSKGPGHNLWKPTEHFFATTVRLLADCSQRKFLWHSRVWLQGTEKIVEKTESTESQAKLQLQLSGDIKWQCVSWVQPSIGIIRADMTQTVSNLFWNTHWGNPAAGLERTYDREHCAWKTWATSAAKLDQDTQRLFLSEFSFVGRCCKKKMLPIQAHSTEARNSSSQVGMNDVTGTGTRLSAKSCSLRHWLLQPQHLWMSQGRGLTDARDWLSAGTVRRGMRWHRIWVMCMDFRTILSFLFWHQTFRAQAHLQTSIYFMTSV